MDNMACRRTEADEGGLRRSHRLPVALSVGRVGVQVLGPASEGEGEGGPTTIALARSARSRPRKPS